MTDKTVFETTSVRARSGNMAARGGDMVTQVGYMALWGHGAQGTWRRRHGAQGTW